MIGADGMVITDNGRAAVDGDNFGAEFPEGWKPKPLNGNALPSSNP